MARGMLLGLLDGIGDIIGNIFQWLFDSILAPIISNLLTFLIEAIFTVVKYLFGYFFYVISVFLLQLIDFVELLFRLLAGLGSEGATLTLDKSDVSGDLLVQALRSEPIVQAFLSCCIVGVFLLIIMTIFQMLKVEYTSEGAQNSKSSIIGKSLKSLTNLFLMPVLVIFGVVIGNSILGLIDTATGGGTNKKISGVMWVTAASGAMWNVAAPTLPPDFLDPETKEIIENTDKLFGAAIKYGISYIFEPDLTAFSGWGDGTNPRKEDIEIGFSCCTNGYQYSQVGDVIRAYNIFEINYLLLIFGACIIIKCLFLTCFGLIDRIYQCLALFIVSPMVIGMSPVKDSLASWRSKFMQKALSAYGIVLSMNLFFIIVDLFMGIGLRITVNENSVLKFDSSLISGLVRCLFVIVGCLMIEKLAGDLGQYFGAGNAMAEGKGLAAETAKGLTTAAKVGVGVAMGGAGIASKLGKGIGNTKFAQGIKNKVGGVGKRIGGIKLGKNGLTVGGAFGNAGKWAKSHLTKDGRALAQADGGISGAISAVQGAVKDYDTITDGMNLTDLAQYEDKKQKSNDAQAAHQAAVEHYDALKRSGTATREELAAAEARKKSTSTAMTQANTELNDFTRSKGQGTVARFDKAIEARGKLEEARGAVSKAEEDKEKLVTKQEDRKKLRRDKFQTSFNALSQIGKDGLTSLVPGPVGQIGKDWNAAMDKGNSYSDEAKQMLENVKKDKTDRATEKFNNRFFMSMTRSADQKVQTQRISAALIERAEFKTNDLNDKMQKMVQEWESLAKKLQDNKITDSEKRRMGNLEDSMYQLNSDVKFSGTQVLNADIKFDISDFKKEMEEAIQNNASKKDVDDLIAKHLKKWGDGGNKEVLAEIKKALEEIKGEIGK